jgi:predicted esterase
VDAAPPSVTTDWCVEGLFGLDEETCYVLPPLAENKPRRLLVYLHGIVPPTAASPQKTTVESAVKNTATRAGAAALVPRGRRGIGPEGAKDWYAWPTSPKEHVDLTPAIATKLIAAKKRLEEIAGVTFERTYLAGSSNGAYYISALALRGDLERLGFPIDGYGAMSGGGPGGYGAYSLSGRKPVPIYVGHGAYDEDTKKGAKALGAVFEAAKWPVRVAEHPFGHGAREIYLDEAFEFWGR